MTTDDLFPDVQSPIPPLEAARRRLAAALAAELEAGEGNPPDGVVTSERRMAETEVAMLEREAMRKP